SRQAVKRPDREVTGDFGGWLELAVGLPLNTARLGRLYQSKANIVSANPEHD
ncbi:MAG: hypothetical protein HW414_106, partial [Dehalococcoidia bacterium]|nr:hypothetical protein [Dehalococcoidia bacterium]